MASVISRFRSLTLALALSLVLACSGAARAQNNPPSWLAGGGALWVARAPSTSSAQELASLASQAGVKTLFVKAANGRSPEPEFATLVANLRTLGVSVCAWTFVYGEDPLGEARAAETAVTADARCLIVDAEGQYDKRYGAAQTFVHELRSQLGQRFPIALAGQADISEHPKFPYSVFLGPGGFNFDMPQIYWHDFGLSVQAAYTQTLGANALYKQPILPVGQLYNVPSSSEIAEFRSLALTYGCPGFSLFDLEAAQPAQLASTLAAPVPTLHRPVMLPTIRAGADGDEIVWAQELLNAAGAHLPVGGYFGAQTARALAHFQAHHRLPANGVLTPSTWRALLRLRAAEPSWAKAPPDSAR